MLQTSATKLELRNEAMTDLRSSALKLVTIGLCAGFATLPTFAQQLRMPTPRTVIVPQSSKVVESDTGLRAHANVRFLSGPTASPSEAPPYSGYAYETPASLACVYKTVTPIQGCNPVFTTNTPSGGSQTIAIVDAYDDPNAAADLAFFSVQFGLPYSDSKFQVVYAGGVVPPEDPTGGWELEESTDIEYAHAMAPNATIYLVEANSNYDSDLYAAVQVASNLVACGQTTTCPPNSTGKGEVSMSWGGSEYPGELNDDANFTTPNVVYFAAAGDAPGAIYPCVSPNVVCAGGTTNSRSLFTGNLIQQIAWSDAGGGVSVYEPTPSYQLARPALAKKLFGSRGVPDLSADSNPNTGVWVWTTFPYEGSFTGWFTVGGTSVATPVLAGIVNSTGKFAKSSAAELTKLYAGADDNAGNGLTDIQYGACYYYSGFFSEPGWDFCTGLGTPNRLK